jgi:hypothetical protein
LDNVTHTLFGATLGRTSLGRAGRGITATLILASNAPDIDIVATAGGSIKYLEWHRGMTHGPARRRTAGGGIGRDRSCRPAGSQQASVGRHAGRTAIARG